MSYVTRHHIEKCCNMGGRIFKKTFNRRLMNVWTSLLNRIVNFYNFYFSQK